MSPQLPSLLPLGPFYVLWFAQLFTLLFLLGGVSSFQDEKKVDSNYYSSVQAQCLNKKITNFQIHSVPVRNT